jgi:arabinogalactan endo-1,4-beta-galactosidase
MLVLGHPPLWAAKGGSDGLQAAWMTPGSNRPPVSDQVWANYVVAVAERYKGRIKQYQIWNEPIDPAFYTGTFTELAQLVYRAKSLINRTDPNAKIVSPPLQPRSGWNGKGKELYQALHLKGDPFDFWSAHIYPFPGETTAAWEAQYNKVAARVWSNQQKPVWITETNMNLGGTGNPYPPITQEKLKKQIAAIGNKYSIPRIYWYAYHYNNPSLLGITNT